MPHRMLNLDEAAHYLHMSRPELETLVRRCEIPVGLQGERIVFQKKELDSWASQRIMKLRGGGLADYHHRTTRRAAPSLEARHAIMPDLFQVAFIAPALHSRTRASVLRDMVELAERTERLMDPKDLFESLREREEMCSTALPGGVALLHPRHHDPYMFSETFVVFGRTVQAIPFGAPDGSGTDLFFLLCCQDDRIHLHVLARVCCMCHNTSLLDNLRAATDATAIRAFILQAEEEAIRKL